MTPGKLWVASDERLEALLSGCRLTQAPERHGLGPQEVAHQLHFVSLGSELSHELVHVAHASAQIARINSASVAKLVLELLTPVEKVLGAMKEGVDVANAGDRRCEMQLEARPHLQPQVAGADEVVCLQRCVAGLHLLVQHLEAGSIRQQPLP